VTTLIADVGTFQKRAGGSTSGALSPSRALAALVAEQRDRWILWLAPAVVAGAAVWLVAPTNAPAWLGPALMVAGVASAWG